MGQKNNFLRKKKRVHKTQKFMRGYSDKMIEKNLLEVKNDHERTSALFCLNSKISKWDMGS